MIFRLCGSVLMLFSILVLPYWIYIPVLFLAIIYFPFYWEGILLAFFADTVYGSEIEIAIVALILLIILLPLRDKLRFQARS